MKIGTIITLTDIEQRIARFMGKSRSDYDREHNPLVGPGDADDYNVTGYGAELAFCRLFNVCPDFDIGPHPEDCERFGESIDVKTTKYPNGKLIAWIRKRESVSDCYALMIADWPRFRFCGFMRGDELIKDARVKDLGHGPTFVAEQSELTADQIQW